jgi:hypothetical protein
MSKGPVFRDAALQRRYDEFGYATFPLLGPDIVREISDSYSRLNLEDKFGIGYKVSLYSSDIETRRRAREFLVEKAFPALDPFLVDRYPYMATYLVKERDGRSIPSHQDWSHCDETRHDSLMCWIPLCDVDEHNGGLGFINGSHRYFDYIRVFPYSVAQTPVDCHGFHLLSYLNILRMRAGDVVVFNNRVIHGSLPNSHDERRTALSFALHPKGESLIGYYLKPKTGGKVVVRYRATPEFYLEYPNPRMVELYARGDEIQGYESEEISYEVPTVAWEELEAKVQATGNQMDPGKVPALMAQAGAARDPSGSPGHE